MSTADKVEACMFNLYNTDDMPKAEKALRIALAELTVEMRREELSLQATPEAADELERAVAALEKEQEG